MTIESLPKTEVKQIIKGFNPWKAPGPDEIISKIVIIVFKSVSKTVTTIYNECLKKGCFPKKLEDSQDNSSSQTWQSRQPRPVQISPNQFAEYRSQGTLTITD